MKKFVMIAFVIFAAVPAFGQLANEPRKEDQFSARRVAIRLDMPEKINQPLQEGLSPSIYAETGFPYSKGMVAALVEGLRERRIVAVNPEDLHTPVTYESLLKQKEKTAPDPDWNLPDPEDCCTMEEPEIPLDPNNLEPELNLSEIPVANAEEFPDLETSVEIIEDRIFDKRTSELQYRIRYIRLVWTDPGETLPDKNVACIPYDENTRSVLEQTLWPNRFNDAETRSVAEVLDLRLFNPYIVSVSGAGVKTMDESAHRAQQLVEYEHHLWQY